MIQWPSIPADGAVEAVAEPVMLPTFAERDVQAFLMPELPGAGFERESGESPAIGPVRQTSADERHAPSARRRRWSIAAIFLSAMAHAAAIYLIAGYVAPDGVEAETDAVSAVIVVESQPDLAEQPVVTGDASETAVARAPESRPLEDEQTAELAAEVPPDEVISEDSNTDIVAEQLLPEFSPLPPLADPVAAEAEPLQPVATPAAETAVAPEFLAAPEPPAGLPVLAAPPSIEAMLPDIPFPTLPLARASSPEQKVAENAPETSARPVKPKPEPRRMAELKPARKETRTAEQPKPPAREKPDKTKTAPAPAKPKKVEAKDKGRAQEASRAGAVASVRTSAGEKENYGRKVNGHVQRFRRYPQEAARKGIRGAVRVSISISGSGGLAAASVQASSGYPMLDKEALATVRRAAPYPRPPEGFGGVARFSLTLRFSK